MYCPRKLVSIPGLLGFGRRGGFTWCLGGFLSSRFGKTPWGTAPTATDDVFDGSFAIMVMCFTILIAGMGNLLPIEQICHRNAVKLGLELSMPNGGITGCLFAMIFPFLVISTWLCGHWSAQMWRHPTQGVSNNAGRLFFVALPFQLSTLVLAAFINRDIYKNWVFLLGMAAWLSVSLYWVTQIWLETRRLSSSAIAVSLSIRDSLNISVIALLFFGGGFALTQPSLLFFFCGVVMFGVGGFWGYPIFKRNIAKAGANWQDHSSFQNRLLINAGFLGLTFPGLIVSSVLSPGAAFDLGIGRFQEVLFSPAPPLIASNTVALAASPTGTSTYTALAVLVNDNAYAKTPVLLHPNASEQTLKIFAYHVYLGMGLAVIWIAFAIAHAGFVFWFQKQGQRLKESIKEGETGPTQIPVGNT